MGGNDISSVGEDMYELLPKGLRYFFKDIKIEKAEIIKAHQVFIRIQRYVEECSPETSKSVFFIHQ